MVFDLGGSPHGQGEPGPRAAPPRLPRAALLYERVVDLVEQLIADRGLRPGDMLPTYTELAEQAGVSLITVRRALDELERAGRVRRHQGLRALHRNPEKLFQAHRFLDALTQVLPFNKLHDQKDLTLFFDHVMNSRDVRIVEAGRAFGLFLEAATIEGIRAQVDREPLEGDGALQASVFRPVHFPHATFAQPLANHKAAYGIPGKRPGHLAVRALRPVFCHGEDQS